MWFKKSSSRVTIVGIDFRDGILFVPEVLQQTYEDGMAILNNPCRDRCCQREKWLLAQSKAISMILERICYDA